jgi:hypothetical protein
MSEYIIAHCVDSVSGVRYDERREEIVRCRDCKHHELQGVSYSDKPLSVCTAEWCEGSEHDNPLVEPNGFCAWGERKEA